MKFILFDNFSFTNNSVPNPVSFSIIPDTAIFRDSLYFIPRDDFDLYGTLCLFLKVSRVGKHISDKFAFKYVDQFGFAIQTYFPKIMEEYSNKNISTSPGYAFDNAIWQSVPTGNIDLNIPRSIEYDLIIDSTNYKSEITINQQNTVSILISEASKFFTIKVGDILLLPILKLTNPIKKGSSFSVFSSDQELLKISTN